MKRIVSFIFTLAFLLFSFNLESDASNEYYKYSIDEAYIYPVTPDMDEWKLLPSVIERREACSVPYSILIKMTDSALVETVITHPYFSDVYAFDTVSDGIKWVSEYVNGVDLLLERNNICDALEDYLEKKKDRIDYLRTIKPKEMSYSENHEIISYINAATLLNYIKDNYISRDESNGINTEYNVSFPPLPGLSITSTGDGYVYTPNGSGVYVLYNCTWSDHNTTRELAEIEHYNYLATYPSTSEVFYYSISPLYNCHSYAWYSQSSSNYRWMPDPYAYISDGSYVGTYPIVGAKITYYNSGSYIHSGVVTSVGAYTYTTHMTSKWGCLGLYNHLVDDCPYYSNASVSYWKIN